MDSVSTMIGLAGSTSVNNDTEWFDKSYSNQVKDILDSVQISATSQLVCGERSSYFSSNVQMVSGRGTYDKIYNSKENKIKNQIN